MLTSNADGNVVEVDFLNAASLGDDLSYLPEWERVERLIREAGLDLAIRIPDAVAGRVDASQRHRPHRSPAIASAHPPHLRGT